ncbi:MAG TPA: hypothetical protein VFI20_13445, partial [Terracidiphilus sp.]|nr:hypothetical protein [Terracidiphilus sp.]
LRDLPALKCACWIHGTSILPEIGRCGHRPKGESNLSPPSRNRGPGGELPMAKDYTLLQFQMHLNGTRSLNPGRRGSQPMSDN